MPDRLQELLDIIIEVCECKLNYKIGNPVHHALGEPAGRQLLLNEVIWMLQQYDASFIYDRYYPEGDNE